MDAIALLRATVDPRWVTLHAGAGLHVDAHLALPDGEPVVFGLRIVAGPGTAMPQVWEERTSVLPSCPARHFYADGSFCMGFGATGPPLVLNEALARRWWAVLRGYLELQVIASLTGEWPPQHARAHGAGAALMEELLDVTLEWLPAGIRAGLLNGTLARSGTPGRATRRRAPCPCGGNRQLRDCHESVVIALLDARDAQATAEAGFWKAHAGHPCCGTMKSCPLRTTDHDKVTHAR